MAHPHCLFREKMNRCLSWRFSDHEYSVMSSSNVRTNIWMSHISMLKAFTETRSCTAAEVGQDKNDDKVKC